MKKDLGESWLLLWLLGTCFVPWQQPSESPGLSHSPLPPLLTDEELNLYVGGGETMMDVIPPSPNTLRFALNTFINGDGSPPPDCVSPLLPLTTLHQETLRARLAAQRRVPQQDRQNADITAFPFFVGEAGRPQAIVTPRNDIREARDGGDIDELTLMVSDL